jgi:hypothetical protein
MCPALFDSFSFVSAGLVYAGCAVSFIKAGIQFLYLGADIKNIRNIILFSAPRK